MGNGNFMCLFKFLSISSLSLLRFSLMSILSILSILQHSGFMIKQNSESNARNNTCCVNRENVMSKREANQPKAK